MCFMLKLPDPEQVRTGKHQIVSLNSTIKVGFCTSTKIFSKGTGAEQTTQDVFGITTE